MAERKWARRADDFFHSGVLVGIAVGGFLTTLVVGLAVLLGGH